MQHRDTERLPALTFARRHSRAPHGVFAGRKNGLELCPPLDEAPLPGNRLTLVQRAEKDLNETARPADAKDERVSILRICLIEQEPVAERPMQQFPATEA